MRRLFLCMLVTILGTPGMRAQDTNDCGRPPEPPRFRPPFAVPDPPVPLPFTLPPGGGCHRAEDGVRGTDQGRWTLWWEDHRGEFLPQEARPSRELASTESVGFHTGLGIRRDEPARHRLTADELRQDYLPPLLQLLLESDPALASSAVLAIARIAPAAESSEAMRGLIQTLSHPDLATRQAATLALGILGDRSATEPLRHLLMDSRIGRRLNGQPGGVEDGVRVLAAAALGILQDPAAVSDLEAVLLDRTLDSRWELKTTAVSALGLMPRRDEIAAFLFQRMAERDTDPRVRARVPGALAQLYTAGTVPSEVVARLGTALEDPAVDALLVRALVVSLGKLARVTDSPGFERLLELARRSPDDQTRHLALLSLASLGARDEQPEHHPESHGLLESTLEEALLSPRRGSAQPYAALALAIYARDELRAERHQRAMDGLLVAFRRTASSPTRAAIAVSLGILHCRDAEALLGDTFHRSQDPELRGYLALALGMLGASAYVPELRAELTRPALDPGLRLQLARALGLLGDREAPVHLEQALKSAANPTEFMSLARALALIGDKEAAPLLRDALQDPARSNLERGFACAALGTLAEKRSLPGGGLLAIHTDSPTPVPVLTEVRLLFVR